jgi:hypothetical protein
MKRIRLIALFIPVAAVFGLVAGKAKTYILHKVTSSSALIVQPGLPVALAHVPAGLPIVLSNLSLRGGDDGNGKRPRVESFVFRAVALGGQSLTSLNFVVFEFDAQGTLRRGASFISEHDGVRQGAVEITLPFERRLLADDRLVLAVERAGSGEKTWEIDFPALAKQAANVAKGRPAGAFSIREGAASQADVGSVLCLNGIRRARALAQPSTPTERPGKITSFTCDQNRRLFAFTIIDKDL